MLNPAKVAILAVSNQIGHGTRFQLIFDGSTRRRLIPNVNFAFKSRHYETPETYLYFFQKAEKVEKGDNDNDEDNYRIERRRGEAQALLVV